MRPQARSQEFALHVEQLAQLGSPRAKPPAQIEHQHENGHHGDHRGGPAIEEIIPVGGATRMEAHGGASDG